MENIWLILKKNIFFYNDIKKKQYKISLITLKN